MVMTKLRSDRILQLVRFSFTPQLLLLKFVCFPAWLMAAPVGVEQVEQVVNGWLAMDPEPLGVSLGGQIEQILTFTDSQGIAVYFVVELNPNGFVVISADDSVEPIICFSASDNYSVDDNSPLWAMIGSDVPSRIQQASSASVSQIVILSAVAEAQGKWDMLASYAGGSTMLASVSSVSDLSVQPLVQSTWGQFTVGDYLDGVSCYNYYTPPYEAGNPENYPCGCVATAMAQLMRGHEYPVGAYNWADMPLKPDSGINLLQRQTIGQFCFEIAEVINTIYSPRAISGSQASLAAASGRLRDKIRLFQQRLFGHSFSRDSL